MEPYLDSGSIHFNSRGQYGLEVTTIERPTNWQESESPTLSFENTEHGVIGPGGKEGTKEFHMSSSDPRVYSGDASDTTSHNNPYGANYSYGTSSGYSGHDGYTCTVADVGGFVPAGGMGADLKTEAWTGSYTYGSGATGGSSYGNQSSYTATATNEELYDVPDNVWNSSCQYDTVASSSYHRDELNSHATGTTDDEVHETRGATGCWASGDSERLGSWDHKTVQHADTYNDSVYDGTSGSWTPSGIDHASTTVTSFHGGTTAANFPSIGSYNGPSAGAFQTALDSILAESDVLFESTTNSTTHITTYPVATNAEVRDAATDAAVVALTALGLGNPTSSTSNAVYHDDPNGSTAQDPDPDPSHGMDQENPALDTSDGPGSPGFGTDSPSTTMTGNHDPNQRPTTPAPAGKEWYWNDHMLGKAYWDLRRAQSGTAGPVPNPFRWAWNNVGAPLAQGTADVVQGGLNSVAGIDNIAIMLANGVLSALDAVSFSPGSSGRIPYVQAPQIPRNLFAQEPDWIHQINVQGTELILGTAIGNAIAARFPAAGGAAGVPGAGGALGVGTQAVNPMGLGAGKWPALLVGGKVYIGRMHSVAWEAAGRGAIEKYGYVILDSAGRVIGWIYE